MTTATALAPELLARMDALAQDREAARVSPGWWIRTADDDGTYVWVHVHAALSGVDTNTKRKAVCLQGFAPGEMDYLTECWSWAGDYVACLNRAEARRLGLRDPRQLVDRADELDPAGAK